MKSSIEYPCTLVKQSGTTVLKYLCPWSQGVLARVNTNSSPTLWKSMNVPPVHGSTAISSCTYVHLSVIILKYVFFRYVSCAEIKQNVSIPACEMENEGWEVTAKRLGARYVYKVDQCQAHVLPYKTLDWKTRQRRGLWVSVCCEAGQGQAVGSCAFEIPFEWRKVTN